MRYLITGGTGFVGSYVTRRLLREGHDVVAFDFRPAGTSIEQILTPEEIARIRIVDGDVTDLPRLRQACEEARVERLIHLAYLLQVESDANPVLAVKVNCDGTANVLEVAKDLGIPRVVWASSVTVFGPPAAYPQEFVPNDAPHHPVSVYGACKSLCEYLAHHYHKKHGVDSIGLRFSLVYGVGRMRGGGQFAYELINKPALGEAGNVPFGDDVVDWLYVDDAARGVVLASQAPPAKTRAFTMGGELRPMHEVARYVRQLIPDARISLQPGTFGITWKYDTSRIAEELGFRPEWTMERGIRETINQLRQRAGLPLVG
jgi:nucleoside-diphosphate-sugar epimerase